MANLIQIPSFNPAAPANIMAEEWADYRTAVAFANMQFQMGFTVLDPNHQHPALPAEYVAVPPNATARLHAANVTTIHFAGLMGQLLAAHQQALLAAQPQQPQQLPPPPPPVRIKTTPPTKYSGKSLPAPPAHFATWNTCKAEPQLHFANPQERKKAAAALNTGKIVQTTSVRSFIDHIQEYCIKAGYMDQNHHIDLIESGLKYDVAVAMAGRPYTSYQDYVRQVVSIDEKLQWLKEKHKGPKKTSGSGSSSHKQEDKDKPKVNNSKYKLTNKEKQEHVEKKLCFKCHKPGHGSKDCKNPRTVYAEVKKVTNVEAKEEKFDKYLLDSN